jgi:hypothetical protein
MAPPARLEKSSDRRRKAAMPPDRPTAKHEPRAICALFAVFALMVQALIPSAAMAARPELAGADIICIGGRIHTVAQGGGPEAPAKTLGGMPCQDCLAAAMAVVTPAPAPCVQRVAYAIARVEHAPVRTVFAPRARAPPRPPGQGPPAV